jgi:hypothetical protein
VSQATKELKIDNKIKTIFFIFFPFFKEFDLYYYYDKPAAAAEAISLWLLSKKAYSKAFL